MPLINTTLLCHFEKLWTSEQLKSIKISLRLNFGERGKEIQGSWVFNHEDSILREKSALQEGRS